MIPVILTQRNTATVNVKGTLNDENGKPQPFHFKLMCRRISATELQNVLKDSDRSVSDFMLDITEGWRGVKDEDGQDVEFSTSALEQLLDIPGLAGIAFKEYLQEQAAKAKN